MHSDRGAGSKAKELDESRERKFLPAPALYKIASGVLYSRSKSEAVVFQRLAEQFQIVTFDEATAMKAAEIGADS